MTAGVGVRDGAGGICEFGGPEDLLESLDAGQWWYPQQEICAV